MRLWARWRNWSATSCAAEPHLGGSEGPVIASTDYVRGFAEQIRAFVQGDYSVLGTEGFGRFDSRPALRRHFEVDRHYVTMIALNALNALADRQAGSGTDERIDNQTALEAINKYGIDAMAAEAFEGTITDLYMPKKR